MKKNILTAIILFFATAVAYIATAPPSVHTGDSGEIATAVYTWGIAHPTGFPAYLILAKLFSHLLPWFEFAYRLNIFSALCGAATVGILFLILQKLQILSNPPFEKGGRGDLWPSVAAVLSLAFGFTFWTHSSMLQVYSLTALFFTLAIFVFLHWLEKQKPKYLYLLAAICGIGVGTHLSFLLFFPFAFILFIPKLIRKEIKIRFVHLFFCFLVFLFFCFLVYSYIPWRAAQGPELNWGNPSTKENFINYITQRDYSDKIGTRSFESWKVMLGETGRLFSREFTWLGLLAVIFGAIVAFKKTPSSRAELTTGHGRPFFYAASSVIFFNILLLGNYGNSQDIIVLWRYFLPSYIIMAVFMAIAINTALSGAQAKSKGYIQLLALILPAIIFFTHFGPLDQHDNVLVPKTTQIIFDALPQKGLLVVGGDTFVGDYMYEQTVLGKRNDLIIISQELFTHQWYRENKKREMEKKGMKYSDDLIKIFRDNLKNELYFLSNASLKEYFDFFPAGIIYKAYFKNEKQDFLPLVEKDRNFWEKQDLDFLKPSRVQDEALSNEIVHFYIGGLNNFAAYLANNISINESIKYFEKSLAIRENKNALYNLANIYNKLGDTEKALEYKARFDEIK